MRERTSYERERFGVRLGSERPDSHHPTEMVNTTISRTGCMTAHNAPKTVCRYLTLRSLQTKTNIQLPVEPQLGQPQLPHP